MRRFAGAALFVLFALALIRLPAPPDGANIDSSYRQAYGHFLKTGAQAGVDYVFNYGPLGHFIVPVFDPDLYAWSLTLAVVMAATGSAVLVWAAMRLRRPWWAAAFAVLVAVLLPRAGPEIGYLAVMVAATWALVSGPPPRGGVHALVAAGIGALALTKFTLFALGGASIAAIVGRCLLERRPRDAWVTAAASACALAIGWLAAGQRLSNLPAYVLTSLEFSRAYGQGMAMEGHAGLVWLGLVIALLLLLAFALFHRGSPESPSRWARTLYGVAVLLLLWKLGVVRPKSHMAGFFAVTALLPFFFASHASVSSLTGPRVLLAFRMTVVLAVGLALLGSSVSRVGPPVAALQSAAQRLVTRARLLASPLDRRDRLVAARAEMQAKWNLPRTREVVGDETIDVFPPFQGLLFLNGLNYHPRPVIQGYQALTPRMLRWNGSFYRSADAPAFVLYRLVPIDGRYPAMEDGEALRALFARYVPVARERGMLLLRRRPAATQTAEAAPSLLASGALRFGEWARVPAPGNVERDLVLLHLDLRAGFWGRLRGALFKLPAVELLVRTRDGATRVHRIAPGSVAGGFILSPYLGYESFEEGWPGREPGLPVEAFTLRLTGRDDGSFQQPAEYRLTRVAR